MEGKGRDGTLIADIEDNLVVRRQTIMIPMNLWRYQRHITLTEHQHPTVGMQLTVIFVEVVTATVGKHQRALVGAVDVGEIGAVGIDVRPLQRQVGLSLNSTPGRQAEQSP